METMTHWIRLVEDERALDTFVFDRAEEAFHVAFDEFRGGFGSARRLVVDLQNDLQKIMVDLVKQHGGNWFQRIFKNLPPVSIRMDQEGSAIAGETGITSKRVTIHLPYPVLVATIKSDEVFDEVCQLFAGTVVHEFVHAVQMLKKQFTQDQLKAPGASGKRGDFSTAKGDPYLAAPHELEAYAHTVAYDLIRVLRKVPETMRAAMMNTILSNRHLMAAKSKSYERYVDNASGKTIDTLDGMVERLLRQHFAA